MISSRRQFLKTALKSSALISLASSPPTMLQAASRIAQRQSGDNVLVVIQLSGGNDGLNTVIPYGDDAYRKNRFTLAIEKGQIAKVNDYIGFHPSMKAAADLLEDNRFSVIQGVGYPNPNRSHFSSMDIWHTAMRTPLPRSEGWLGQAVAARNSNGKAIPGLHIGSEQQPRALVSGFASSTSISSIENFHMNYHNDDKLQSSIKHIAKTKRSNPSELLHFLQSSTNTAITSSEQIQEILSSQKATRKYPNSGLAKKLKSIAQLIDANFETKIYYLTLGGFDTHSLQKEAHAGLLRQYSEALKAFLDDLKKRGHDKRVLVTTFSEFGRRVRENASRGTDHGAAAPMFLAGGQVKPGLIGKHPSLTDLDDGDLKYHTDFRQVYASILESWLGLDSQPILKTRYTPLPLFA